MTSNDCPRHSGLAAKVDNVAADVREIKADVKALCTAQAAQSGFAAVGRTFALSLGALTPMAALLWALWER
jgi:hypothetical protein